MADRVIKILEPATELNLLTLEEAKLGLGISVTDTSHDAVLTMQVSVFSETVAALCNRIFAREKVIETWRDVYNGRLFLSHWPVKTDDIESVTSAGTACNFELEERSGKISYISPGDASSTPWNAPAVVTYTGGFDLPDEAPLPLKQATIMLIRDERMRQQQAQVAGIRQISHKESRVAFFDPNLILARLATARGTGMNASVDVILKKYMHIEV